MRVIKSAAGLADDLDSLVNVEMAAVSQQLRARLTGNALHDDEMLVGVLVEPEVEHLHDVRVHEPGRR